MKVELLRPVNHDNQDYQPGDVIDLSDDQANALVQVGSARIAEPGEVTTKAAAQAQAKSMLNEAEGKVKQLVADAKEQASKIVSEAKAEAEKLIAEAQAKVEGVKTDAPAKSVPADGAANEGAQQTPEGQQSLNAVPKKQGNQ